MEMLRGSHELPRQLADKAQGGTGAEA